MSSPSRPARPAPPPAPARPTRRSLLLGGVLLGGGALVGLGCGSGTEERRSAPPSTSAAPTRRGYGPLVDDGELALPEGFSYRRIQAEGDPLDDGNRAGPRFDGMAAFALPGGTIALVRNHEVRSGPGTPLLGGAAVPAYDATAGGGTTTLEVAPDGEREVLRSWVSLSGTLTNCAGGPTPWGSWLTCEETTEGPQRRPDRSGGFARPHGYVFEVPADGEVADPRPLTAMGRFAHEAVTVDPDTGVVYLTEDNGYDSGLYRFTPDRPGDLAAGGRLEIAGVAGRPGYDTAFGQRPGTVLDVVWSEIDDPDPAAADLDTSVVFNQGLRAGGARFKRLEGTCWSGGSVWFTATEAGDAALGQVWRYDPSADQLHLVVESTGAEQLDLPDNVCASPGGGIVICEDGDGVNRLRVLGPDGELSDLAENTADDTELCGACFSPDGETLFVNVQGDDGRPAALTYAIWGPWDAGPLA